MQNTYLERYAYPKQLSRDHPNNDLGIVITIPCFNESTLIDSLDSLRLCKRPHCSIEIIVVINEPENAKATISRQNRRTYESAESWAKDWNSNQFRAYVVYLRDLPQKHAGVGLARKIAMDEAVRRFEAVNNHDGVIACFDADCTCDDNYLIELEDHFESDPNTPGCSIYFEHPLDGENAQAIVYYELFLRYYVNALKYAGFPYAFQTIGSSMAVRSWAYQKQGGMNRRKAGEDFYFLHRIIPLGNFTELNSTRVIPSPRSSDRVPFGTGRAILDWQSDKKDITKTYHPKIFEDLKLLLDQVSSIYKSPPRQLPESVTTFLRNENFDAVLDRIRKQSTTPQLFTKHFFHWFDGFKVLKYVHFARDNYYRSLAMEDCLKWLFKKHFRSEWNNSLNDSLKQLRMYDRQSSFSS